ncbi:NtaA/DmoA family FMN-dependent monooxygenase [Nesterenkonia marinintestina]|uniref:NtaA/DmoA family FMN-dependent monooxygenase n=1 Tax=Nesterenkonia marinintestina TaxID=2979865 RepID=UPI0021C19F65|nr:NtaA/DmoA family FMN-dependent monooxygenase [Nesterenkonia sp. GX14115]
MTARTEKPLILSAFLMNTTSHIIGGAWRRESAEQHRFNELRHWTDLVRRLEEAGFDLAFFADVVGVYGDHEGGWASHLRRGLQVPANDPLVLISALAAVTDRIGLAMTSSVIQAHPFTFARQLSTLDHLSGGRVGWNVVTSATENAHRNFGGAGLAAHGDRYDWAEEYLDVAYQLWEGSWEDGALLADKTLEHERGLGLHADPTKVAKIHHRSSRYEIEGPHLSSPSPQRTPYLFQAGSSDRGREVAARHAEATFSMAPRRDLAADHAADVRRRAVACGRRAEDVAFIQGLSFVIGSTEAEARERAADLDESLDVHALIAHTAGSLGVDVGGLPIDTPLDDLETEGAQGHLGDIRRMAPNGQVTLRDLATFRAESTRVVGTPEQIADELAAWREAGIDGINIINSEIPGSYAEFIDHVMPVLRERGLARPSPGSDAAPQTLRGALTGSDRLPDSHPAARYRGAFTEHSAAATESAQITP